MKTVAILLAGVLTWLVCHAMTAWGLDPDRTLAQLSHQRWTLSDGLPGEIGALAQTRDGYLWLGAGPSLFRFDGVRFIRYLSPDGESLPTVSSLLASPSGGLWVGLRSGGVRLIEGDRLTAFSATDGVPKGVVYGFALAPDNTVWAAAEEGLAYLQDGRWRAVSAELGFTGKHARAVYTAADGAIWAASEGRLYRRPPNQRAFIDTGETVGWVTQIGQATDGSVWIAQRYGGGVRAVTGGIDGSAPADVGIELSTTGFAFDRDGTLWVGTPGEGLRRVSPSRTPNEVDSFTEQQGLSGDYVRRVLEDAEGNLWIGTSKGLDRFRHTSFITAPFPSGSHYFALAEDPDGSIWAGTINRPVMRLSDGRVNETRMPPPVTAATTDEQGVIWMGGPSGIWRSQRGATRNMVKMASLPASDRSESVVRAMVRDRDGTLWVSLNDQGLFRFRDGTWARQAPPTEDDSQVMPVTASIDGDGRRWFGYRNDLVVTIDADGIHQWGPAQGVNVGHVTALHHGARLNWIGGQRGLGYFDGRSFRVLSTAGDPLAPIYGIVETAERDLWLHTLDGTLRVPASEIDRAMIEPDHRVRYRRFEDIAGLPEDPAQVRPLPTMVATADGRIWLATSAGVVWVDPSRVYEPRPPPPVVIETVSADGRPLHGVSSVVVPALTQRLSAEYTAPGLGHPEHIRFRFQLEGYDTDWQEVGTRRSALYTRVPPGSYRFRVQAANHGEDWTSGVAVVNLVVQPAFFQSLWFRALCGALLAALLWAGHRLRLRRLSRTLRLRLEERHRERERIARDLHDTLLQSVQGLLLKFHAATERLADQDPVRDELRRALDRAEQVLVDGRERVKGLRDASDGLADLPGALLEVGRSLEEDHSARLRLTIQGKPRHLTPLLQSEVFQIGREALINAFVHASAKTVEVEVTYGSHSLQVRVRDDGSGIDQAVLVGGRPDHFGMAGMQERADQIGATLAIWSREGSGTEVELRIPASVAYGADRSGAS